MALQYTDNKFYVESYLQGRAEVIPSSEFSYWSMQASSEIREKTYGNVDALETIPDDVQMCCCEVAEKLYLYESAKGDNGMILQSYGNDGDTGTYKTEDYSQEKVAMAVDDIIQRWLLHTGLLYCGVCV